MRLSSYIIPVLSFLPYIIAIQSTQHHPSIIPTNRTSGFESTKVSRESLEGQASKQIRLLQLKYSQKFELISKDDSKGPLMKRASGKQQVLATPNISQRQVGYAPLKPDKYNIGWTTPYKIVGGKEMDLLFDTGSSNTIINKDAYTPSPLAEYTGYTITTTYMDGTTGGGKVILDYIEVGGLTIQTTLIWANDNFLDSSYGHDGILGVGFADTTAAASLVEAMVQNFTMLTDLICMTMMTFEDGGLQFGTLDANIVKEIQYTDTLTKLGHAWDTTASINGIGPFTAIIDTGTTFTWLPMEVAKELFAKLKLETFQSKKKGSVIPDGELWAKYPCHDLPPQISITVGDITTAFTLSPKTVSAWTFDDCRLSILGSPKLTDYAILGASFLKNVHLVMDRGLYKMGFAQRSMSKEESGI